MNSILIESFFDFLQHRSPAFLRHFNNGNAASMRSGGFFASPLEMTPDIQQVRGLRPFLITCAF